MTDRARAALTMLVLAALGLVSCCAAARADTASFPASTSGISLGLAFDYHVDDVSTASRDVSYVFGGKFIYNNPSSVPSIPHTDAYMPFELDPYDQTVSGHTLSDWQAVHPDWVVYQCDGHTPAYFGGGSNTEVPLDFSNPAVRQWQVQQAAQLLASPAVQGISFDDFSFGNWSNRCGVYKNGVWTSLGYVNGGNNAKYQSDMMSWLEDVRSQLSQEFPTKTITVNYPGEAGLADTEMLAPYVDAVFDEAGFTNLGQQNLSGSSWQQEVDSLEYLNAQGKAFMVNGSVSASSDPAVTHAQLNWVLANYLLVKGARSYTYVYAANGQGYTGSPSGYGTFYDRPEYHISIGAPISARYQAQGVQLRNYSGGLTIVNPSPSQPFTVTLPRVYHDMWGQSYTSVTLAPASAIVLLGAPASVVNAPAPAKPPATNPPAHVAGAKPASTSAKTSPLTAVRRHATALLGARVAVRFRRRNNYRITCVKLRHGARCTAAWNAHGHRYAGSVTKLVHDVRGQVRTLWRVHITRLASGRPRG